MFQAATSGKEEYLARLEEYATRHNNDLPSRRLKFPREKMQVPKVLSRFAYKSGPMFYIGQQIVRSMHQAGYPAEILEFHGTPADQDMMYVTGLSAYPKWKSPHQYGEAVKIGHPGFLFDVSDDYWGALRACASIVTSRLNVKLVTDGLEYGGQGQFMLPDWTDVMDDMMMDCRAENQTIHPGLERHQLSREPTVSEMDLRFKAVLPRVWAIQNPKPKKTFPQPVEVDHDRFVFEQRRK